ncbi:hypothetical protein [Rubrivirga sp.]|uniref:hypothetical protein n=1 Tax=Rubrivirga sp. TaxID=1885344 RepID=UPI003C775CC8
MSRNVVLPLLGLIGIVLFSLNRLGQPVGSEVDVFAEPIALEAEWDAEPQPERAFTATPPPAPRLRSDLERDPELASQAEPDSSSASDPDSTAATAPLEGEQDEE